MKLIVILCISFFMLSCTSMREQECSTKNWYKQGIEDAKNNVPKSQYGEYKETCLRFGISFDKEEYVQGYESIKSK